VPDITFDIYLIWLDDVAVAGIWLLMKQVADFIPGAALW